MGCVVKQCESDLSVCLERDRQEESVQYVEMGEVQLFKVAGGVHAEDNILQGPAGAS